MLFCNLIILFGKLPCYGQPSCSFSLSNPPRSCVLCTATAQSAGFLLTKASCLHFFVTENSTMLGLCENVHQTNSLKLKFSGYQVILHSSYLMQYFHKGFGTRLLLCPPRSSPAASVHLASIFSRCPQLALELWNRAWGLDWV